MADLKTGLRGSDNVNKHADSPFSMARDKRARKMEQLRRRRERKEKRVAVGQVGGRNGNATKHRLVTYLQE